MTNKWSAVSSLRLKQALPPLQDLFNAVLEQHDCSILDALRNKANQEIAFKRGNSKVHFGDSAHNWFPCVALDVIPYPHPDWNNNKPFIEFGKFVVGQAKKMKIPIRWGGDWNMDGSTSDGWDFPHFELNPWRDFAHAHSHLYKGE